MPLTPAKCPECGGFVEVDNDKRAGLCQHCHQPFVIEDAIQTFNTYYSTNNVTNHNYGNGAVVNVYENQNSVSALIERAFMFLEDGNFSRADEYCEKVLDIEPENARAYLGKLMADLQIRKENGFDYTNIDFSSNINFPKVMAFGDEKIKELLTKKLDRIRIYKANLEKDLAERKRKSAEQRKFFEEAKKQREDEERKIAIAIYEEEQKKQLEKLTFLKEKREQAANYSMRISGRGGSIIGVKSDGTLLLTNELSALYNTKKWVNMVSVCLMDDRMIGLKADGTVVAAKPRKLLNFALMNDNRPDYGQCDVSDWTDIIAISAGDSHTVGLKSDGTVVATKIKDITMYGHNGTYRSSEYDKGQCDVSDWKDIVAISANSYHTVGLKADGTVVATGDNTYGRCDVSNWIDVVAISTSHTHTVGIKSDGTVVTTVGDYDELSNVKKWTDIVSVYDGSMGLKADGTVVAVNDSVKRNVSNWTNIIAICSYGLGIKSDGSVVAICKERKVENWKLF